MVILILYDIISYRLGNEKRASGASTLVQAYLIILKEEDNNGQNDIILYTSIPEAIRVKK